MWKWLFISMFFVHTSFGQLFEPNKFFLAKGNELLYWDGAALTSVIRDTSKLCFPFVLKGKDLFMIHFKPVLGVAKVATGVTQVFANGYLIGSNLYTVKDGRGVYVTNGVTEVYNNCPDPYYPRFYGGMPRPDPF
jgi:hypothetical protein